MNFSTTRAARRAAVAAGLLSALGGALGASTASAVPVSATLNYVCTFPLLKPEPLTLEIKSDIPAQVDKGKGTGAFDIVGSATVSAGSARGLRAVETATLEGSAFASSVVTRPDGSKLNLVVPTTITKAPIPASGGFVTSATGKTPSLVFSTVGTANIAVGDLVLDLTPRLADGLTTGLDRFETECKQVPGQNNTLANIRVVDPTSVDVTPPSKPGLIIGTPSTSSVALTWGASSDNIAVTGYDVYRDGVKVATVATNAATVSGLLANTSYTFKVQAKDSAGNVSAFSDDVTVKTSGGGTVNYGYDISGNAILKTLTKGSVPLKGTINASLTLATEAFTGDLALNQATANLVALGFLPVTAKIAFVSTAPTTGTLKAGVLLSTSKVRIKLPQVTLFGIQLAGGANCQAKNISSIGLKSTGAFFNPLAGGTLAGTFSISDLAGCGALTGIVSPLTAGGGNAIALKLTPKPTV